MNNCKKITITLGITAGIAAYKACDLIGILKKKGFNVVCAVTRDALNFVTPLTLETLTGEKVITDMFSMPEKREPCHISLAEKSSLIAVVPATADFIGKIASGLCDDILSCSIFAASCPVIFAPAMNDKMYANPIIQEKINYLRLKGYDFVEPVEGHLACNRIGMGHLAPLETIAARIEERLKQ
ncbi:phosphopantothenoylcysteine decarboxylase/phosphopantothenate/cysteine ligase [Candidatus Omnitrophus magneticus]|uniref:Phosphopantothenoylcysteine decarboxylase/phosphopantothenate/cysteine ligase n=1 Tax=Candidatus Omnitrophus magneticus TaxID=1609969 RepID=A0A0F0CMS0_9BACT|nr:phosphopantothenoylcysteine decarboxylase/phosphopantothenate/cysteine ligase [Candidatus Omnitrophus magneticus]